MTVKPLKRLSHGAMAAAMGFKIFDKVRDLPLVTGEKFSKPVPFFKVGGFVTRIGIVTTAYGDSFKMNGEFRADMIDPNGVVGEFSGTTCYLTSAAADLVTNAWNGRPPGTKEMKFLFNVSIKKIVQNDGTEKYEFDADSSVDIPVTDRMTELFTQTPALEAPAKLKALPKPKAARKKKAA